MQLKARKRPCNVLGINPIKWGTATLAVGSALRWSPNSSARAAEELTAIQDMEYTNRRGT